MKIKTANLTGPALDWAVEQSLGGTWRPYIKYSTDWAQGGPIIEREGIRLDFHGDHWDAMMWWDDENVRGEIVRLGPTPLIAAMRCFIASRLGDEVDIPNELEGV